MELVSTLQGFSSQRWCTAPNTRSYAQLLSWHQSPAFGSTQGLVLVTCEVVVLDPALPEPHAGAAQCTFHQQAPALTLVL